MKVKKIVLTFLFALAVIAVENLQAQVHLGFKGGTNLGKIEGVAYKDQFMLGYHLGGYIGFDFSKHIGLQTEVLFNQSNTKMRDSYTDVWKEAFEKSKKLDYVSVPVLLKVNPKGTFSVVAGPQFSILVNRDENLWQNGEKLFKSADFSLVAGAELNINPLVIYARYGWGFADISNLKEKANSQQIQVGVGLRLF
ncbi:porin family protein [Capnocytophaga canimorsus]|uniref:porin family protein n=1 Tax=Capnocytophaga canimorsus TaxID=28188 RepID=UPI0037D28D38